MNLHGLAEARSLAYHRRVAELLRSRPDLLEQARRRAAEWSHGGRSAPYAAEWLRLLDGPFEELLQALTDESERGKARRQATPFSGALEARDRWRLWRDVRAQWEQR